MKKFWIILLFAGILGFNSAGAAVPPLIHYQGRLTETSGMPVNGTKSLTFGIYDQAQNGNQFWTETQSQVTVSDGIFSVMLGSQNPLNAEVFNGIDRYLEVKVDGTFLSPRSRLVSSAYAFRSAQADSLTNNSNLTTSGKITANILEAAAGGVKFPDGSIQTKAAASSLLPAGTIIAYGGETAPAGWMICNGEAVSRSTYSDLFNAIGITYGVGNGTSTFTLPDLRGRTLVGTGAGTGLTTKTLGNTGGEENHTLTAAEMPSHSHQAAATPAGSHSHTGNTYNAAGAHSHNLTSPQAVWVFNKNYVLTQTLTSGHGDVWMSASLNPISMAEAGRHEHSLNTTNAGNHSHPITVSATGAGNPHNNLPPYAVVNYIIKY